MSLQLHMRQPLMLLLLPVLALSLSSPAQANPTKIGEKDLPTKQLNHAEFVRLLGKAPLSKIPGTTLSLNLRPGELAGAEGFIENPETMVIFTCPAASKAFRGGKVLAKVAKVKSNDNGVFVKLDRCEAS